MPTASSGAPTNLVQLLRNRRNPITIQIQSRWDFCVTALPSPPVYAGPYPLLSAAQRRSPSVGVRGCSVRRVRSFCSLCKPRARSSASRHDWRRMRNSQSSVLTRSRLRFRPYRGRTVPSELLVTGYPNHGLAEENCTSGAGRETGATLGSTVSGVEADSESSLGSGSASGSTSPASSSAGLTLSLLVRLSICSPEQYWSSPLAWCALSCEAYSAGVAARTPGAGVTDLALDAARRAAIDPSNSAGRRVRRFWTVLGESIGGGVCRGVESGVSSSESLRRSR